MYDKTTFPSATLTPFLRDSGCSDCARHDQYNSYSTTVHEPALLYRTYAAAVAGNINAEHFREITVTHDLTLRLRVLPVKR